MAQGDGLKKCEEALDRLIAGKPQKREHRDIQKGEITAAMVSVEAGYDKGYLKKGRDPHKPLLRRIDSLRDEQTQIGAGGRLKLAKALKSFEKSKDEHAHTKEILNKVLTQNIMLVERVRELEEQLTNKKTVVKL